MSAVTSIVLNDALATPVAHTFVPIGPDQTGTWWFEDQSASSPIGYNRISMSLVRARNPAPGANAGERIARVKVGIHTPKLESLGNNSAGITPPPTIAYIPRCNIEFILPERSSLQDRKDLRKFADFLLAEAQLTAMVEALQSIY
jgi:hypothetical protein